MRNRDELELDTLFLSQCKDIACRIDRGKQHIDLAVDQPLVRAWLLLCVTGFAGWRSPLVNSAL